MEDKSDDLHKWNMNSRHLVMTLQRLRWSLGFQDQKKIFKLSDNTNKNYTETHYTSTGISFSGAFFAPKTNFRRRTRAICIMQSLDVA